MLSGTTPTAAYQPSPMGGGPITIAPTAAPHVGTHSMNPAVDAALSQAYTGIAQYTGTLSQWFNLLTIPISVLC